MDEKEDEERPNQSMELKTKRAGGAHLMALIIHQPIFSPSKSAESTPRQRSRPRSLFFRDKINSPTCSEPTSPKVNCAGRVKERAAMKGPKESKADKKSALVRSLTSSLRGSMFVDGAIRCCRSPRDFVSGDGDGEEEGEGEDLARWFMTAELAGKKGIERMMEEGEVEVLAPLNALQLMKQRSASARVVCMEGEGEGEVVGERRRNWM